MFLSKSKHRWPENLLFFPSLQLANKGNDGDDDANQANDPTNQVEILFCPCNQSVHILFIVIFPAKIATNFHSAKKSDYFFVWNWAMSVDVEWEVVMKTGFYYK